MAKHLKHSMLPKQDHEGPTTHMGVLRENLMQATVFEHCGQLWPLSYLHHAFNYHLKATNPKLLKVCAPLAHRTTGQSLVKGTVIWTLTNSNSG